uniref:Protein kinase domain-containing protein n=1 Tax=Chromera velia CCMP2878 TaxID=1169474 RepID=A0A0G4FJR8_9ALVE|eukprot:Cvel_17250.t1-p1 / transcript=Cvel_17250.t1 / gene=Cvel_17250 / organism=Chromera_velia_CCMP2878 / gene_product=Mitogen-activated protein kinase HOG1, putative / transcript_product=Mitogen-activated protein kinase HOG1, putative / location=Cvel_scaffold1366:25965-28796(+) / protein_length=572 / sequence_SO=supercontig / SO=protein_coding / is_pseudo=false
MRSFFRTTFGDAQSGGSFVVEEGFHHYRQLGEGAYGRVCQVEDYADGTFYAIKQIDKVFKSSTMAKRILRELRLPRLLQHENILSIRDVYCSGEENTIINETNFSAVHIAAVMPMTPFLATRWYRAPELIWGEEQYDGRVDVWASGCVLAEMLGGGIPLFPGENNSHQLELIVAFLGLPPENELKMVPKPTRLFMEAVETQYVQKHGARKVVGVRAILGERFPTASAECLDLLAEMLSIRPTSRLDASACLSAEYCAADDTQKSKGWGGTEEDRDSTNRQGEGKREERLPVNKQEDREAAKGRGKGENKVEKETEEGEEKGEEKDGACGHGKAHGQEELPPTNARKRISQATLLECVPSARPSRSPPAALRGQTRSPNRIHASHERDAAGYRGHPQQDIDNDPDQHAQTDTAGREGGEGFSNHDEEESFEGDGGQDEDEREENGEDIEEEGEEGASWLVVPPVEGRALLPVGHSHARLSTSSSLHLSGASREGIHAVACAKRTVPEERAKSERKFRALDQDEMDRRQEAEREKVCFAFEQISGEDPASLQYLRDEIWKEYKYWAARWFFKRC